MSTNEQFAPNEDDLAMVQRPSTITILYMILGSVQQMALFSTKYNILLKSEIKLHLPQGRFIIILFRYFNETQHEEDLLNQWQG